MRTRDRGMLRRSSTGLTLTLKAPAALQGRLARTLALLSLALVGCGGGTPAGPAPGSAPVPSPVQLPPLTVLSVISGDDGTPVAGASVQVGGTNYSTDSAGQFSLTAAASVGPSPRGAAVVIEAPGFLPRRTRLRTVADLQFALWPASIPAKGVDEKLTMSLIYTSAAHCCPDEGGYAGRAGLLRMRAPRTLSVGMPDAYVGRAASERVLEALTTASEASGGLVTFIYSGSTAGDVQIKEVFTGTTPQGIPAAGYFIARIEGGYIQGGEITLSKAGWASSPPATWPGAGWHLELQHLENIVAHELGHCLGLQHHEEPVGMMTTFRSHRSYQAFLAATEFFTPPEIALLALAYKRLPGNQFPDSDDEVVASSGRRRALVCVLR